LNFFFQIRAKKVKKFTKSFEWTQMCLADTCTAFHPQHKWRNGFDDHKIILLFALHTEAASHATSAMVYEATAVKEKTPQTGNYSGLRPAVTFENESWPSLHVQT